MSTTKANKGIVEPAIGDPGGSSGWGITLNSDLSIIDAAFGSSSTITDTANLTLTVAQYQCMCLTFTGTTTGSITATIPAGVAGQWVIRNKTPYNVVVASASGSPTVTVSASSVRSVYCDGTTNGVIFADNQAAVAGSNNQVIVNTSGNLTGYSDFTFDGALLSVGAALTVSGTSSVGTTATVTFSGTKVVPSGSTIVVSGVTPTGYNGIWVVTASAAGSVSYTIPAALIAGTGGSVLYGTVKVGNVSVSVPNLNENRTAGVTNTAASDGSISSGTYTPSPTGGNMRTISNAGAFTFAPPTTTGDYTMVVQITNVTGAGAITIGSYNKSTGSPFTTVVGDKFFAYITKLNSLTALNVVALQ